MQQYILRAIQLANAGRTGEALRLLRAVVAHDPRQVMAWKWLAYLSPDSREALAAVYRILHLNPSDDWARQSLPALQQRIQQTNVPDNRATARPARQVRRNSIPLALGLATLALGVIVGGAAIMAALLPTTRSPAASPILVALPDTQDQQAPLGIDTQVSLTEQTTYYTFEAATLADIQQALYTLGPQLDETGEHSIAMTAYRLSVEWQPYETALACRATHMVVKLQVTYTYPQWVPARYPNRLLYDEWYRFMQHVQAHERQHGAIALSCAHALAGLLDEMEPQPTCAAVQNMLNTLIDQAHAACEQRQAALDETEGRTMFPLPR